MGSREWEKINQGDHRTINSDTHSNISIRKTRLCELLGQAKVAQFNSVIVIEKY